MYFVFLGFMKYAKCVEQNLNLLTNCLLKCEVFTELGNCSWELVRICRDTLTVNTRKPLYHPNTYVICEFDVILVEKQNNKGFKSRKLSPIYINTIVQPIFSNVKNDLLLLRLL